MSPDVLITAVAALTGFVLKTSLAFGVCWLLGWLVDSPKSRFMVWLSFLYGAGAYWLWLAKNILGSEKLSSNVPQVAAQPAASSVLSWQLPGSWAVPASLFVRAAGIIYLLVLGYIFLAHIQKRRHLKWALRFTYQPPADIAEVFRSVAERLHVGRSRLLVLPGINSPATFGWMRPMILLPALCLEQDRSDLEDILHHELQHILRWDFVWNGFAIACRALLFFHPAAWYAVRKMQFDRELACDLAVVSDAPGKRAAYAECLVRFARLNFSHGQKAWGIDFAASSHLRARVRSILAGSRKPSAWVRCLRTAFGLALFAGFLEVAPSAAVFISYAHTQIEHPVDSDVRASHARSETREKFETPTRKKIRPIPSPTERIADAAVASVSRPEGDQVTQPEPDSTYPKVENNLQRLDGHGPQLLRRPLHAPVSSNTAKEQSVTFAAPGVAGQAEKKGDPDRSNVLQQSALLAGGIYRRIAALRQEK